MTVAYLPFKESITVMIMPYRSKRVIAARVCNGGLDLVLGNLDTKWVSLNGCKQVKNGPIVDLSVLKIEDYGQTICLGDYQVAVDFLLEETK